MRSFTETTECFECEGSGFVEYEVAVHMSFSNPYGYLKSKWSECETCLGTGEIEEE